MITSLNGSFSGLIAYRDNTTEPFRGTFDSRFQEFDPLGVSAAIDALSNTDVVNDVTALIPLSGSFVGVNPGTVVAVRSSSTLNLTIDGEGYFNIVDTNSGVTYYTRNLNMQISGGSTLAFNNYEVQPMITLPPGTINFFVEANGMVSVVTLSDPNNPILVGQIQTSTFNTPPIDIGNGIFAEGASSPITGVPGDPGFGSLIQGFIEEVNPARSDISDVVLRMDATITRDNGIPLSFAVVYEFGEARLVGSEEVIELLRSDTQGFVTKFNTMLQNATGDPNLSVQ